DGRAAAAGGRPRAAPAPGPGGCASGAAEVRRGQQHGPAARPAQTDRLRPEAGGSRMNDVLLTVSGKIEADIEARIARGERPLADYIAMARGFPADLSDYPAARRVGRGIGRLLEKIGGPNLMLAWACFRQRGRYRVIFTDGEQVG